MFEFMEKELVIDVHPRRMGLLIVIIFAEPGNEEDNVGTVIICGKEVDMG